ncbi:hypothetical protein DPMN_161664 [Dreissena polymorpha]|uniref:Uncharacterized protein n=1 Tax=Dreissena polymorpha TaxID=45954 RepID=A0A9D4EQ16_DREPO|nr:hypothetical protein DPMN_161664 [Dreissena polymorpha]
MEKMKLLRKKEPFYHVKRNSGRNKQNVELHCYSYTSNEQILYFENNAKEVVDSKPRTEVKIFRHKYQFDQLYGTKASTKTQVFLDSRKSSFRNQVNAKAQSSTDGQLQATSTVGPQGTGKGDCHTGKVKGNLLKLGKS